MASELGRAVEVTNGREEVNVSSRNLDEIQTASDFP